LKYTIDDKSENPNDNLFVVHNPNIKIVNIKTFLTNIPFGSEEYYNYDLREPKRKIINPDKIKETKKSVISTTDWSNIPHYPTTREKRENVAKYLIKMGKVVPPDLLKQIQEDKKREIDEDVFNNFDKLNGQVHGQGHGQGEEKQQNVLGYYNYHQMSQQENNMIPPQPPLYQNHIQNNHISKIPIHVQRPPNKFSPQYASYIGAKPKAQSSARVRLGGVF
jgi:hypothetical protein